ncbi:wall-associated receptor kinase-like 14 [Cornus florida]|uniref:wall-associated receptor kinase-like 14 n=1 Tax=Cornus florida TaxID=4283 RepID=UPI0028A0A57C|nr:wall-associated receptor kinase-like 14 [Cornus florida]
MILSLQIIIIFAICIVPITTKCIQSCGTSPTKHLPYPFGFSDECPIQLNCNSTGDILIHDFPVRKVDAEVILIHLQAKCDRPITDLHYLFGRNFAPTSRNGILLQNCSLPITACLIPTTMVQTHFELLDCGSDGANNISCYSEQKNQSQFIDYHTVEQSGCGSLFSAISAESFGNNSAVSLDVQAVQLGWWVEGDCDCSDNANCSIIVPPVGRPGHRCQCFEGFVGDGFNAGLGCRKASSACNPAKYMSGQCGGTTRVGVLVGGIAAGAALMISIGLICCFIRRRSNSKTRNRKNRLISETTDINIPIYPYREIQRATNSFSDEQRLGTGAYGTVYSGKLYSNEWVAIKRIKHRDTDTTEQVMNEIKLISSVNHPNLVRLLGCSIDKDEQILLYEFMPNGTLSQHLQRQKSEVLTWPVRLTIASETAQAIAYLHSAMKPPIYHRDIKSSNILLDYNFKTKVADFGLSRLGMTETSHISTAPQGTPGYLDPQYHQDFHLSDKSDVYSFGVVLVEIITALKAVDFSRPQNEVNLACLAINRIGKGCLEEIIDPFLEPDRDAWTLSTVHKVAELAFRCLAFHRDMRPPMMEVAAELEQIRLSRSWVSSEDNIPASSEASFYSSSSSISEKPLSVTMKKPELDSTSLFALQIVPGGSSSMDGMKDFSPVSVQDSWPSEQSSPSSNSLLNHVVQ